MGKVIELNTGGLRPRLREVQQQRQLVRIWRGALEHGSFCGYVAGVGREFFLLWVLGDAISFDGMYVLRHRDVTELEAPDAHHVFLDKALSARKIVPRLPRGFPLDDVAGVLEAASLQSPVIGVHVDSEDESEVCYIGRLLNFEDEGFNMQELTPDAEWLREPSFFAWDEVSTVSFDEPYAAALLEVAGKAPELSLGDSGVGRAH